MLTILRVLLFLLALTSMPGKCAAAPPLRLAFADVETFPYQMGNGSELAEPPGVAVELIRQAAAELGLEVEFARMPNKRVIVALKAGSIDGAFIFSHSEERENFARYPLHNGKLDNNRRIARLAYSLYRAQNSIVNWDGSKFTGLQGKIGANAGYSIVDDLHRLGVAVEEAKNTEQNFDKLKFGRVAAVAAQDDMADPFIAKLGLANIEKLPKPIIAKDYFLIFSHQFADKNSALAEKLWDRVADLRERRYKEMLIKYATP